MEKTIDKQTMLDLIVEAKRTDPETGGFAEWLAEYLAEHLSTLTPVNEAPPCYQPDGDGCSYQCYDGDDEPIDKCKECPLCYSDKQRHHAQPNEWVSVEERIPNFGKLVIATDGTTYGVAWLCSDCTWMVTMGYKSQSWFGRKVTHWMNLSAPPTKEM